MTCIPKRQCSPHTSSRRHGVAQTRIRVHISVSKQKNVGIWCWQSLNCLQSIEYNYTLFAVSRPSPHMRDGCQIFFIHDFNNLNMRHCWILTDGNCSSQHILLRDSSTVRSLWVPSHVGWHVTREAKDLPTGVMRLRCRIHSVRYVAQWRGV